MFFLSVDMKEKPWQVQLKRIRLYFYFFYGGERLQFSNPPVGSTCLFRWKDIHPRSLTVRP